MSVIAITQTSFQAYSPPQNPARGIIVDEKEWFERSDRQVIGVVLFDLRDHDYGWVALKSDGRQFRAVDMGSSLATAADARTALEAAMLRA